ncbi:probable enoyl-CoA hydratase 1, peroxisomal [Hordeum vulgare subsp. vulgare]|uniref:Enoyl-CoA hydratase n=1 Tax=Hordeum vulgare subsp. vulgare TaxID=112509 RepID=M0YT83_HORVV|nr:probable enoyl-CoA hydratase 1, peroxisomal [Hordeum vulgare subsp. vulgare]
MDATSPVSGDLILVEPARPGSKVAVVTINRPDALNALTRSMMISLASAFRQLDADDGVAAVVLAGRGRSFCAGVDLTAAEEVFKGDVNDPAANPVAQMELCRKPIVGAVAGFAVTAGFEIALACDLLVAGRSAKFLDTHAKFGIFPSWGLSQKLSRLIGPNRAREVSLTCMPVTAEMAEKWGLANHIVEDSQVLSKAIEVAEAIARNNRNLVVLYKSVINDGLQLDMKHARALEKERAVNYYNGMTKEQFANMQKFIQGRSSKPPSKL